MDKPIVPRVDAHMRNPPPNGSGKKDQIPLFQCTPIDWLPCAVLTTRGARESESVQLVHGHGQPAAIEAFVRRGTAPSIGETKETLSCGHDVVSQIQAVIPSPIFN